MAAIEEGILDICDDGCPSEKKKNQLHSGVSSRDKWKSECLFVRMTFENAAGSICSSQG